MPSITAVGDISELVWRSMALVSGFSVTLLLSSALVWRNGLREAWLVPLWAKGMKEAPWAGLGHLVGSVL